MKSRIAVLFLIVLLCLTSGCSNSLSSFRAEVEVAASHVFYSWVFGFGGKVKIKGPENVKQEYKEMIQSAAADL